MRQVLGFHILHSFLFSAFLFSSAYDDSFRNSFSIPNRFLPLGLFPIIRETRWVKYNSILIALKDRVSESTLVSNITIAIVINIIIVVIIIRSIAIISIAILIVIIIISVIILSNIVVLVLLLSLLL